MTDKKVVEDEKEKLNIVKRETEKIQKEVKEAYKSELESLKYNYDKQMLINCQK